MGGVDQVGDAVSAQPCSETLGTADRVTGTILMGVERIERLIDERTAAVFCESIANPGGYITDLETAQKLAPRASVGGEYTLPQEYFALLEGL